MRCALILHPHSRSSAVTGIAVKATRPRAGALHLRYVVRGAMGGLRLPPAAAPARADGLWQHTCFEAFLRAEESEAYYELNFAPSTQWAAYAFARYREGMQSLSAIEAPAMAVQSTPAQFALTAAVDLDRVPGLAAAPWQLGLSAVIEEAGGNTAYWALRHPPGRADFHHPDCFALTLPAP